MALSQENNRFAACKKKPTVFLSYVVLMADLANNWHNIIECNFKNHRIILHWWYMSLLYALKSQPGSKCLCVSHFKYSLFIFFTKDILLEVTCNILFNLSTEFAFPYFGERL